MTTAPAFPPGPTVAAFPPGPTAPMRSTGKGDEKTKPGQGGVLGGGCPGLCQIDPGIILFSDTTGNRAQYSIRPDGTDLLFLGAGRTHGAWTPDYSQFVVTTHSGNVSSFITLADLPGAFNATVTKQGPHDDEAVVSPDGKNVAFSSDKGPGFSSLKSEIYTVPLGTLIKGVKEVTFAAGYNRWPTWSPDGNYIVFASTATAPWSGVAGTTYHLYRVSAAGNGPILLNPMTEGRYPTYSPDGTHIAFAARQHDGSERIAVMNPDGTGMVVLATAMNATQPTWSRDGTRIAFASNDHAYLGINVMNADGTNVQHISSVGSLPKWSR